MGELHQLRWKLFGSHLLVLIVGVAMIVVTARYLARTHLLQAGALPVAAMLAADEAFLAAVDQGVLLAVFAALAAAVVVSLYVSWRIVQPLRELSAISQLMARGYYRERATIRSHDELADLSHNINQLADALDQIEQRRMALIADMAHELRTPLMVIEGYVEGIADGIIAPEPQTLAMIRHETSRLKRLVADLILLSRAEAGRLEVMLQPVNLPELLGYAVAQFQLMCEADGLQLTLTLPDGLPPVRADPSRLEQVLINLLSNAVRYTPNGGSIVVSAALRDVIVEIAVRDTGMGIPAEHLVHIFDRFYRVDRSRARASGGTGIGLTIAGHLMHAQNGTIWAESDGLGRGATFFVAVPVEPGALPL